MLGKLDSCVEISETGTHPHTMHKINSAWLKDFNGRQDQQTPRREHGQNILSHQRYKCFLRSVFQGNRNKNENKPVTSFCTAKETVKKTKVQPREWEKLVSNNATDKGLISKTLKQLIQLNSKKPNNPTEDPKRMSPKEMWGLASRHMRNYSASVIMREMQIKTAVRYHLTPIRMAISNDTCWRGRGEKGASDALGGNAV